MTHWAVYKEEDIDTRYVVWSVHSENQFEVYNLKHATLLCAVLNVIDGIESGFAIRKKPR